ncbi:hypothetical protein QAD02_022932 [Eretmocerus hayati]|uniref:Uncharacterized protein n=1 Tax=Eretmocerus hayati TaxID=131215 RepID=A0ACC2PVJ3_9HYME|nr:hypothetical protein QAD02_022932 [Eretmocerus hayati]
MKAWREATSLIIAAKNAAKSSESYDYALLLLKRSQKTSFAGAFVFPGGLVESADADLKWHNIFQHQHLNGRTFESLFYNLKDRPVIFHKKNNQLPREVSLRISAIRETFEECGVLFCQQIDGTQESETYPISGELLNFWQQKVHNDASEFYNMCSTLKCFPNIWALQEWGNWLTPTYIPAKSRFNTAFFFTSLGKLPNTQIDHNEVDELLWAQPQQVLNSHDSWLPPPQMYEISSIADYHKIEDLKEFALKKAKIGAIQFFPVRILLRDGIVVVLPGDSMYPTQVNFHENEVIEKLDMTVEEFRNISTNIHRTEIFDDSKEIKILLPSKL